MSAATILPEPPGRVSVQQTRTQHGTFMSLPDGSMVLRREDLAIIGNGDPVRGARDIRAMVAMGRAHATNSAEPSPRPASVRVATPADEGAIHVLMRADCAENAESVAPIDDERIAEQYRMGTRREGGIVGVIDGPDGSPVAVLVLVPMRWWWSQAYYFQEMCLYVHPDHRRSRHAQDLRDFQRWWVEQMSRTFGYRVYLLCGVLGLTDIWRKGALYRRRFKQVGAVFIHPTPPGQGG